MEHHLHEFDQEHHCRVDGALALISVVNAELAFQWKGVTRPASVSITWSLFDCRGDNSGHLWKRV